MERYAALRQGIEQLLLHRRYRERLVGAIARWSRHVSALMGRARNRGASLIVLPSIGEDVLDSINLP